MFKKKRKLSVFIVLCLLVCAALCVSAFAADGDVPLSNMYGTFWALVPPIIAIILALITKEVFSSLFIGVLVGALFQTNFNIRSTMDVMINDGFISAIADNAGIFMFLVILGIIVALLNKAGGSVAFGRWAEAHIKTRTGAMFATFVLGVLIFIDDYFNCLTVGSVMRPVTDVHKISRSKLAYIIDATAAPVCMIAPISSWAAAVSSYVESDQFTGIELFIKAIPYNFYSLLTFVFIIALFIMKFDYGPMKIHEFNAMHKNDLYSGDKNLSDEEPEYNPRGRVIDLVLPVIVLIATCIVGIIINGGMLEGIGFMDAFAGASVGVALPWGALIALVFTFIYLVARRTITFKDAMNCIPKGFIAMVPAILILTFAVALKNITVLMGSDVFVDGIMSGAAAGLTNMLPAVIFIVACVIAFASGTSWGTFGILIPIVTAVFPADSPLLFIGISACLAGAVCGDHCSPISDTTIMSSAGAQCDHVNHVSTQLPYAITVALISFVTFIIAGFVQKLYIALPAGIILTILTLVVIKAVTKKNDPAKKLEK